MGEEGLFSKERREIYRFENVEYKTKARNFITKELGFTPKLRASLYMEVLIRRLMKRNKEGIITDDICKESLMVYVEATKDRIRDLVPEQAKLIK